MPLRDEISLLNVHLDRICASCSLSPFLHLVHIFFLLSGMPLVLLILVGRVPERAYISRILFPGFNPLCVQIQFLLCREFIAVTVALPLFIFSSSSSIFLYDCSFLFGPCRLSRCSLSSSIGSSMSPVALAAGSVDAFIFAVALALLIIVVVTKSGMFVPFQ